MICKACGTAHTHALPGSGVLEAVLWIAIPCWPAAVVYSTWRRTSRRKACGSCGSTDLVGLETPVGRSLARAHYPQGLPPAPPPAPAPRVLGATVTGLAVFSPIALMMLWSVLSA
jgi:hypothetical protein